VLRGDPERLAEARRAAIESVAHGHSWRDDGLAIAAHDRALVDARISG